MTGHDDAAVEAAAEVMFRQYESQYSATHLTWRDFADDARAVLDAARPHLEAAAVAAERERCAQVAEEVDAFYDAPCPDGAPGCVHQDTPFADLLRNPPEGDPHA